MTHNMTHDELIRVKVDEAVASVKHMMVEQDMTPQQAVAAYKRHSTFGPKLMDEVETRANALACAAEHGGKVYEVSYRDQGGRKVYRAVRFGATGHQASYGIEDNAGRPVEVLAVRQL